MQCYEMLLPYFRYYRDEETSDNFSWWFCVLDENIYETNDIYKEFGYTSICDICDSGKFIELYKVDIIETKKVFLKQYHPKSQILNIEHDGEFDIAFNSFIETSSSLDTWQEYEKAVLESALLKWSSDNNIIIY
ncbi:MAG: hypothetical protein E7586_02540 [Ruminococcaceae bacterium]|nr:hypothetical protein [Oscillospiraceae bacterium]